MKLNAAIKLSTEILNSLLNREFKLKKCYCESCNRKTLFIKYGSEPRQVRCLNCKYTLISLAHLKVIKSLPLNLKLSHVYELAYHGASFSYLQNNFINFYYSEFFGPNNLGEINLNYSVRNEDIQRLTFNNDSFDLISCTEVLEHVPDYYKGFTEAFRVLKKDGYFIFTVPLFDLPLTVKVAEEKITGEINWLREPEFHDSRIWGTKSVPVFWRHSMDQILKDLLNIGFRSAELVNVNLEGFSPIEFVVKATK